MSTKRSGLMVVVGIVAAGVAGLGLYRAGVVAASPTAVAVVNVEKLMNDCMEAKARGADYEKYKTPLQKELQELQGQMADSKKKLEMLPAGSKDWRAEVVTFKKLEAQLDVNSKLYGGLADLNRAEMYRVLYESVMQAVTRVAQQDGWQLVLLDDRDIELRPDLSPAQVGMVIKDKRVMYADEAVNITSRVLTEMDNAYNAPAPKNPPAK